MRISRKLPLAAALLTIVSISVVAIASTFIASDAVRSKSFEKLSAIADGRRNELQRYLLGVENDLLSKAASTDTATAINAFTNAWYALGADPAAELQRRYITENPNEIGEKHLLDAADEGDGYDSLHGRFHPGFRKHLEKFGYYDIFLFNADGDLVYTVFKELDFATNLQTGEWKDTGLGHAFRAALELPAGDVAFGDFEGYAPSNGAPASFIASPVTDSSGTIGVIAYQMPVDEIGAIMANPTGLGETGENILLNRNGVFISDAPKTPENDILTSSFDLPELKVLTPDEVVLAKTDSYRDMNADMALARVSFEGADWAVAAVIDHKEVLAGVTRMRNTMLMIALAFLAVAIGASIWFSRTITRPVASLVGEMKDLAGGDTQIALAGQNRNDEIGDMVRSVAVFRDAAVEKNRLEAEAEANRTMSEKERAEREAAKAEEQKRMQEAVDALAGGLTRLADGDLTIKLDTPFMASLDGLRENFNASVAKLSSTLANIREKSESIDANSREVQSASDDLSRRTEQQAASLEETSAALEQITATIKETSGSADEVATLANTAKGSTDRSATVVGEAAQAMEDIENASREIANIIDVIDDIAFQTNLLALNAGVEAARAGEAGKGFAVVAQEVRELAQRTAVAAKEIKGLITKSGQEVSHGVDLVKATREALTEIAAHVTEIDGRIGAIAKATNEQLTGVQEINVAVGQIDEVTQKNAAMVEETTAVSHSLAGDVASLSAMIGEFRLSGTAQPGPRLVAEADRSPAAPTASPARKLVNALSGAFSRGGAATAARQEDWEEF